MTAGASVSRWREWTALGIVGISLAITGCSTTVASSQPSPAPAASDTATSGVVSGATDAESCEAFGDVSTILHNAMAGLREGRMTQQEFDGWMRLATRVLDRVPVSGEGEVSVALQTLKDAAPAIPIGVGGTTIIGKPEWTNSAELAQLCIDAGHTIGVEGFTGG